MKILPVGSELFQADRQTGQNYDAFRNFANVPKNCCTSGSNLASDHSVLILKPMKYQFPSDATDLMQMSIVVTVSFSS